MNLWMEPPENGYKMFVHKHFSREKPHTVDLILHRLGLWSKKAMALPQSYMRNAISLSVTWLLAMSMNEHSATDKMLTLLE